MVRFYAAVKDGVVVSARSTVKHRFTHVMLHTNANGTFATFHPSAAQAIEARRSFVSHPIKTLTRVLETRRRLVVGEVFRLGDLVPAAAAGLEVDEEYHQRSGAAL
jgi:hypothetical protein